MADDEARQRAVDVAIEHLVSLTCHPCEPGAGCWSELYREDVALIAAEIAEFRAIEKLANEQLVTVQAALDLEVSRRTVGGSPLKATPGWASIELPPPPSASDPRMPEHRRVGMARSTDQRRDDV